MKGKHNNRIRKIVAKCIFPEDWISRLQKQGVLKYIAQQAIRRSHILGLPVTIIEGDTMYRVMPDGTRIILKELQPVKTKYRRGDVMRIKSAS